MHLIEIDGTTQLRGGNGAGTLRLRQLLLRRAGSRHQPRSHRRDPGRYGQRAVEGCFIGLDPTGSAASTEHATGSCRGVRDERPRRRRAPGAAQHHFGQLEHPDRIRLQRFAGGTGHLVQGNFLGPDATGAAIAGQLRRPEQRGRRSLQRHHDVTIGGATPAARNIISGNAFIGVNISSSFCGACVTDIVVAGQLHRDGRDRYAASRQRSSRHPRQHQSATTSSTT